MINIKELNKNVENTMNNISLNRFDKPCKDLTHKQTKIVHKIFYRMINENQVNRIREYCWFLDIDETWD